MGIMSKVSVILVICLTGAAALPEIYQERIIGGGSVATISQYPYAAAVLYASNNVNFLPVCGGAILNNRSILTALSCWNTPNNQVNLFRARVGSASATSGGTLHTIARLISHGSYVVWNQANNIGILRVASTIDFSTNIKPIPIATSNYILADYQYVWAIGWGRTNGSSVTSEQLRAVEIRTINQGRCQDIYGLNFLTLNQLCAGWEAGGRGSCEGDIGAPLVHNNVIVGVTAYIYGCGDGNYPPVYSRVSRYNSWIISNA